MAQAGTDPRETLTTLGRSWGWILAFGVLTLVAGIVALVWPGNTVLAIAVIFGVELILMGIFRLITAFSAEAEGHRLANALLGILAIVIGLMCVRNLFTVVTVLAWVLGIFWIVTGVMDLLGGLFARGMPHRGWVIFEGILAFVAGLVVLAQPHISLAVLVWVLGIWLVVYGVMLIVSSFTVKKFAESGGGTPAAA